MNHTLRFKPGGQIDGLYTEAIDLRALGRLHVVRATDISFCERSHCHAACGLGQDAASPTSR